jgi:hypothetical protein
VHPHSPSPSLPPPQSKDHVAFGLFSFGLRWVEEREEENDYVAFWALFVFIFVLDTFMVCDRMTFFLAKMHRGLSCAKQQKT